MARCARTSGRRAVTRWMGFVFLYIVADALSGPFSGASTTIERTYMLRQKLPLGPPLWTVSPCWISVRAVEQ